MAKTIVVPFVQRIDADRYSRNAGCLERADPLARQPRSVGADHDRRATATRMQRDVLEIIAQKRLTTRQNEQGRVVQLDDLIRDAPALGCAQLTGCGMPRSRRD